MKKKTRETKGGRSQIEMNYITRRVITRLIELRQEKE